MDVKGVTMERKIKCNKPIYIDVTDDAVETTESISDTVTIDYNCKGEVCGVEITENTGMDFDGEVVVGIKTDGINQDELAVVWNEINIVREMVEKYGCIPGQVGLA